MKRSKIFLLSILLIPWLSAPFLGRNAFKRYFKAALFICIFTKAIDTYGENKRWWRFYKGIPPFDSMNFFNFGPYFVTSLWMLKMTYGKFPLYLISNTILQVSFIYLGGLKFVKHFKIFSLEKLTKFQYLTIDLFRAFLLYGFQYIIEIAQIKNKR